MSRALTWRNVTTPDFRGVLDGMRASTTAFDRAFTGLGEGLQRFDDYRRRDAENTVLNRSLAYNDPARLREAISSGELYQGVNPTFVGRQGVAALDGRAAALLREAAGTEELSNARIMNPLTQQRTRQLVEHEGLHFPLQRDATVASTAASRASAAASDSSRTRAADALAAQDAGQTLALRIYQGNPGNLEAAEAEIAAIPDGQISTAARASAIDFIRRLNAGSPNAVPAARGRPSTSNAEAAPSGPSPLAGPGGDDQGEVSGLRTRVDNARRATTALEQRFGQANPTLMQDQAFLALGSNTDDANTVTARLNVDRGIFGSGGENPAERGAWITRQIDAVMRNYPQLTAAQAGDLVARYVRPGSSGWNPFSNDFSKAKPRIEEHINRLYGPEGRETRRQTTESAEQLTAVREARANVERVATILAAERERISRLPESRRPDAQGYLNRLNSELTQAETRFDQAIRAAGIVPASGSSSNQEMRNDNDPNGPVPRPDLPRGVLIPGTAESSTDRRSFQANQGRLENLPGAREDSHTRSGSTTAPTPFVASSSPGIVDRAFDVAAAAGQGAANAGQRIAEAVQGVSRGTGALPNTTLGSEILALERGRIAAAEGREESSYLGGSAGELSIRARRNVESLIRGPNAITEDDVRRRMGRLIAENASGRGILRLTQEEYRRYRQQALSLLRDERMALIQETDAR